MAVDNPAVQVRAHEGDGRTYLWFVNATREPQSGRITTAASGRGGTVHWPAEGANFDGQSFAMPPRDALIVEYLAEATSAKAPAHTVMGSA